VTFAPHDRGIVVSSQQSERLLTLLQRHGFSAERIQPGLLNVPDSSIGEMRRFALFFGISVLLVSTHQTRKTR
jgi:hypothetical protein